MKKILLPILLLSLLACAGPGESLDKQNYDKAFSRALKKLKKGKSVEANKKVLIQSMEQFLLTDGARKEAFTQQGDISSLESAIKVNYSLQDRIQKAEIYTSPHFVDELDQLQAEANELSGEVSEMYFQRGKKRFKEASEAKLKKLYQQAYYDFANARKYGRGGNQIDSLQQLSLSRGQVIISMYSNTIFDTSYGWDVDRQFDDVESYSNLFRKIYYDQSVKADCVVEIRFRPLDFNIVENVNSQRYNQQVIVDYEVAVDTSGMEIRTPIYENVEGEVITRQKTKIASWTVEVNIESANANCNWTHSGFEESFRSQIQEIEIEGDERAIPDEYKGDFDQQEFMDEDDMAEQLIGQIYNRFINEYF